MHSVKLSSLPHVWFIDIDGTALEHNGYRRGADRLLPGVKAYWMSIPPQDIIVLLSARDESERESTLRFFDKEGLRYHQAIFGLPPGERILINDAKPSGLKTAHAVNLIRDKGLEDEVIEIDPIL